MQNNKKNNMNKYIPLESRIIVVETNALFNE